MPGDIDPLAVLQSEQEIRNVLALYCRAIDRLDVELLREVYHPDATDDHGGGDPDISAAHFRDVIVEHLRSSFTSTQHVLGGIHVDLTGEVASSEAYVTAYHVCPTDEVGQTVMQVIGARYVDRFERREGVWRISRRVAVQDWSETRLVHAPRTTGATGRRDQTDPAYFTA
jgi:hypothetical protein